MKYLKKFENFTGQDLGRFSEEENKDIMTNPDENEQSYDDDDFEDELFDDESFDDFEDESFEDEREEENGKTWGDEVVESKRSKKAKPDFLDLDKDGDRKESMKKAAKDAKSKKDDKGDKKGLTAGQKKLPEAMQKAILKKKK